MKTLTLTLKQQIAILVHCPNGHTDFKKKLAAYGRPMRRLYKLESNPANTVTESRSVYEYVFELEGYKDHQLTLLRSQLREALTEFIEIRMVRSRAAGQNLIAGLYEGFGYNEKANKAYREALRLAPNEAEHKRWLSCFQAHAALHFREGGDNLKKARHYLLLFFLVSFLKLSIEALTIFRNDKNKSLISAVFKLLPIPSPPLVHIQKTAVEYFQNPGFKHFHAFKSVFFEHIESTDSDKKFLLNSLLNAIVIFPNPSEEILRQYIPLYKFGIENNLFIQDGDLGVKTVCNILGVADFLGVYELTVLVKKKLIPFLANEKERGWCKLLAEIYVLFGEQKFAEALVKIKKMNDESTKCFDITFRKNILKLKCSYDISETSADAYSEISQAKKNFDKLLKRNVENNNINELARTHSSNFIKFLMMICNVNTKKYTKAYLLEKLASYKGEIMETRWLKAKIAERPF